MSTVEKQGASARRKEEANRAGSVAVNGRGAGLPVPTVGRFGQKGLVLVRRPPVRTSLRPFSRLALAVEFATDGGQPNDAFLLRADDGDHPGLALGGRGSASGGTHP